MLSGCKNISLAERLDEHHLLAKDWNVVLTSACPIGEEIRAVGIRAHYFSPDKEGCDNCLTLQEWKVIEDPFEWNVSFRPDREGGYLQWKLPKKEGTPISVPERLYVDSRNLLLLK
jgi:molybdate transport system ATP-binding protein